MDVHPWAEEGFGRAAAAYERGRPAYAAAAVAFLVERLGLGRGATTVVDLAAGTGKLARLLVPSGARVIAVEPLLEMRALIPREGIDALDGTAEAIPLPDGSVEAVTVAQAFHWFRAQDALVEIHRVLRPDGVLAVVRNERDPDDPVQRAVAGVIDRRRAHDSLEAGLDLAAELEESGLFGPPERRSFPHEQRLDRETLLAHAGSHTPVSLLADAEREAALTEFRALAESLPQSFGLRWITTVVTAAVGGRARIQR